MIFPMHRFTALLFGALLGSAATLTAPLGAQPHTVGEKFTIDEGPAVRGSRLRARAPTADGPPMFQIFWTSGDELVQRSLTRDGTFLGPKSPAEPRLPDARTWIGPPGHFAWTERSQVHCFHIHLLVHGERRNLERFTPTTESCPPSVDVIFRGTRGVSLITKEGLGFESRIMLRSYDLDGRLVSGPEPLGRTETGEPLLGGSAPRIAPAPDGGFLVAWDVFNPAAAYAQWVSATGERVGPTVFVHATNSLEVAAVAEDGTALVAWLEYVEEFTKVAFHGAFLTPDGTLLGPPVEVATPAQALETPAIAGDEEGNFLVVYAPHEYLPFPASSRPTGIFARLVNSRGAGAGESRQLNLSELNHASVFARPAVTYLPASATEAGRYLVTWVSRESGSSDTELQGRLVERRARGRCPDDEPGLCLQQGRFRLEVAWRDLQGNTGTGHSVPTPSDTSGLFWFFHPDNWELMVKVLDACAFSGHHWVFSAATTNVEYTLTVTDTLSGEVRTYRNELGVRAPAVTDTTAFSTCP